LIAPHLAQLRRFVTDGGLEEIGQSFWVKKIKMKPDFLGSAAKEATLSG
jgi:hypothetical protein